MKNKFLLISSFLVLFALKLKSQTNLNLYNFKNVGQSNLMNPGIRPQANFSLGFSGLYFNLQTPEITLADIFNKNENPDSTFRRIVRDPNLSLNNIGFSFVNDLVFMGFAIKKNYFSFGIQSNLSLYGSPPKDILGLTQGTTFFQNTLNRQIDLGNLDFSSTAYIGYHLGYTREINKKLSVGFRIKYLQGIFNANIEESNLKIASNSDSIYIKAGFKANIAGIDDFRKYDYNFSNLVYGTLNNGNTPPDGYNASDDISNFINKRGIVSGTGWGLDLGANYKFNQHLSVSASVIDFGYIDWNKNNRNFSMTEKEFNYKGIDIENFNSFDSLNKRFENIQDSLVNEVFVPTESVNAYTTNIETKMYLGAQYALNYNNMFDFVFFNNFASKKFNPALNLSFTKKIWSILDIRLSGTYYNNSINNAGLGFSLNVGPFQTYFFSDNLIAVTKYDEAKFINIRTGINWNFGRNNDRDGDGIPNKKDKCWKTYGSIAMKGCTDKDKDGIADYADSCVNQPGFKCTSGCPDKDKDCIADRKDSCVNDSGLVKFNGCPDKDNDGVPDYLDVCASDSGSVTLKGCPDKDNDGVPNYQDSCVNDSGSVNTFGCPDSDNDGIPNSKDSCINEKGSIIFNGCPDSDADDVIDKLDKCPNLKGPVSLNGCPDTDNDGIADINDKCPTVPGMVLYEGCPDTTAKADTTQLKNEVVLTAEETKVLNEVFSSLEFETGTSKIKETSLKSLEELAQLLISKKEYKLLISGHTDNAGKAASNLKLSLSRANAIKDFLISKGVDKTVLTAKGFGSKKPIANNKTPEGRARNRRVEFKILK